MVKRFFINHYLELLLISFIIIISVILLVIFNRKSNDDLIAKVYYNDNGKTVVIKEFDLSEINDLETIDLELKEGIVITLELKKNSIRVKESPCKRKLCEHVGFSSNPNKPIICLDLQFSIVLYQKSDVDLIV